MSLPELVIFSISPRWKQSHTFHSLVGRIEHIYLPQYIGKLIVHFSLNHKQLQLRQPFITDQNSGAAQWTRLVDIGIDMGLDIGLGIGLDMDVLDIGLD